VVPQRPHLPCLAAYPSHDVRKPPPGKLERGGQGGGQGGGEAAVVHDVVQYQVAARDVEPPGVPGLRAAEAGDLVVDATARISGTGQVDQAWRQVDAGDLGAAGGQRPGPQIRHPVAIAHSPASVRVSRTRPGTDVDPT
jgi:hypothetical protein